MLRVNDKTNWERRLAGEVVPVVDGEPSYGFYRVRTRDKQSWRTVAYWYDDGKVRCLLAGQELDEQRACELWPYASQHPISHDLYNAVVGGEPWPDLSEAVTRSNQAPDDNSFEALQDRIDDLVREAERLIKAGPATTQDAADRAADLANKLGELRATANKEREHEKNPHLQAGRDVDDKWRPMIAAADVYSRLKAAVCKPWLDAKKAAKDKAEAEARRVAEAAASAAREAEAEARRKLEAAAMSGDAEMADIAEAAALDAIWQAEAAATATQQVAAIAASTVTAGTRGRPVALRGKPVVIIDDRAAVLAFFLDRQELTDLMQSLAEKAVRAGIVVPGCKIEKDSKAA